MTDSLFQPAPSRSHTNGATPQSRPTGVAPFKLVDLPSREFFTPEAHIPTRAERIEPPQGYEPPDSGSQTNGTQANGSQANQPQNAAGVEPTAANGHRDVGHRDVEHRVDGHSAQGHRADGHSAVTPLPMQPHGNSPVPATTNRVDYLPLPAATDVVNAPVLVIEHRHIEPTTLQPAMPPSAPSWTLRQLLSVLGIMGVIAILGSAIGFYYGKNVEPVYAARSEFIYFLEDALPDGFLREDRRILTQMVTIESEALLQPIAGEFGTTTKELRKDIEVSVVDLSEVIRLDVEDTDPDRAREINSAILTAYQEQADRTFLRTDSTALFTAREQLIADLAIVDEQSREIQLAESEDVELRVIEESLTRELDIATQRFQNLSNIADGLLVETTTVDDTASITSQIAAANQTIARLEQELLSVRSEREQLQQVIRNVDEEFAYQVNDELQKDVALSVREQSIQTQITTAAERSRRLEGLRAESLINNEVQANAAPVDERLRATQATMIELEDELLNVRTQRTQVAQRAAALPSLTRDVERLEEELRSVETKIADLEFNEQAPSPIEILTAPVTLDEPVGSPRIKTAALGFLASVPIALLAGAALRSRQRRRRF